MPLQQQEIVIRQPQSAMLPNNKLYQNRFEIHSETSDSVYIVAQNKDGLWWSCGCFGWIRHRHCKHLEALGLPGNKVPFVARPESAPRP
jgi:hypothetical protein